MGKAKVDGVWRRGVAHRRFVLDAWRESASSGIPVSERILDLCMSIQKNISGEHHELIVPGRVDGALANALELEVLNAIKAGARRIYINFANATFLCSAAIRVVLQYHRQMKAKGGSLLISRVSPEVDSILELTGFREIIVEKI